MYGSPVTPSREQSIDTCLCTVSLVGRSQIVQADVKLSTSEFRRTAMKQMGLQTVGNHRLGQILVLWAELLVDW